MERFGQLLSDDHHHENIRKPKQNTELHSADFHTVTNELQQGWDTRLNPSEAKTNTKPTSLNILVAFSKTRIRSKCCTYLFTVTCRWKWPRGLRNCLRLLKHCGSRFESHSNYGCLCVFMPCLFVLFVDRCLVAGSSPVRGVLTALHRIKQLKKRPRPNKGLWSINNVVQALYINRRIETGANFRRQGTWQYGIHLLFPNL
jgi:hypothetical protein